MFTETDGSRKTIGDVDIVYHDGLYHLFHLVLPNHDFIAHAVSTNGFNWRRVANALFIGDPGSWDDLMLWTMAVSADPHHPGRWRMFYTGLSRREQGKIQRIGLAVSDDLYHWTKASVNWQDHRGPRDPAAIKEARRRSDWHEASRTHALYDSDSAFPLEPDERYYESDLNQGRHWVSFRDPFYYREDGRGWLIAAARINEGPVVRRGCVGAMEETAPGEFKSLPPLHCPGLYDDIEVPNLMRLDGEYYLIGSIREDAKIRYWHTDRMGGPWRSYHDNVLMAKGNYAGRICQDDNGWLFWNFFSMDLHDRMTHNLMPPPKRLVRTEGGLLRVTTFEGFEAWVGDTLDTTCVTCLNRSVGEQRCMVDRAHLELQSEAGFQAFTFDSPVSNFRFRAALDLQGKGKCGLIFRVDPESMDGYYLSLDLLKGVAQLRRWQTGHEETGENMMQFVELQSAFWFSETPGKSRVQLIAFGSYLEFAVDDRVLLSLADQGFSEGLLGVYLETAHLKLSHVELQELTQPFQSDDHLVTG